VKPLPVKKAWFRLLAVIFAWILVACGQEVQQITDVTITVVPTANGVSATPTGVHVDWPTVAVLKLVNRDSVPHELTFVELQSRYRIEAASGDEPAVTFFSIEIRSPGVYHWECTLNCLAHTVEGYIHVAPVH
jgi:hypothetical protein